MLGSGLSIQPREQPFGELDSVGFEWWYARALGCAGRRAYKLIPTQRLVSLMANPVYDGPGRAEHYAQGRWQGTARRRRTARKEGEHFSSMLQECGPLADVADAPCGTGRFAPLLQKATLSCLGADLSSAMLQQCRQAGAYPGKLL